MTVDGYELYARPMGNGVWQAGPVNQLASQGPAAAKYARYGRAVEQASGCRTIPGSQTMPNGYLNVAVDCAR